MDDLTHRMFCAFMVQMLRSDQLDPDDVVEAAETLEKAGDEQAAHAMRCLILEANKTPQSEWEAERRRNRFHVIDGEGYKPDE